MSKSRVPVLTAVAWLILSGCTWLQAATDMFLKLETILGESQDYAHPSEIDVLAWSWGMAKNSTNAPFIASLSLTKYVDAASPYLMRACARGTTLSNAVFTVRTTGAHPAVLCQIALTKILVVAVSSGGSAGGGPPTEQVVLDFAQMTLSYTPTLGSLPRTNNVFEWDILANTGSFSTFMESTPTPASGLTSTLNYINGARFANLTWASTPGANYQVWVAQDVDGAFQRYGSPTPSSESGTTSITVPADAIRKFFRVETLSTQ